MKQVSGPKVGSSCGLAHPVILDQFLQNGPSRFDVGPRVMNHVVSQVQRLMSAESPRRSFSQTGLDLRLFGHHLHLSQINAPVPRSSPIARLVAVSELFLRGKYLLKSDRDLGVHPTKEFGEL